MNGVQADRGGDVSQVATTLMGLVVEFPMVRKGLGKEYILILTLKEENLTNL